MPKEKKTRTSKGSSLQAKASGSRTKRKVVKPITLTSLAQTESETQQKWSQADNTKINYKGYVARAARFLDDMVLAWRKRYSETGVCKDDIDTDLLAQAFDNPPNKYSVTALLNFLTQKCFVEQYGKLTGQGIQAAMVRMWDKMDGQKYAGDNYHFDESTGIVIGNPAHAPSVKEYVKCINTKSSTKGAAAVCHHADAMRIEDLVKIIDYSKHECSSEELEKSTITAQELMQMIKHGLARAFFTLGFTLWMRNFELCGLQACDIEWDLQGPAPYNVPYFRVHLDGCKGWQSKQGWDGPLESNYYNIYAQPNSPDIDMYTYLPQWISLLERCLGCKLEPDDYIFPYCSSNGIIHPKREMTHDMIQNLLNKFSQGAGLKRTYTTHSLHRGGAQYRFMFAPIGRRWSLSVDTLMNYESGHSDALYPILKEADKTFMGDHVLEKPITTAEFCVFADAVLSRPSQSQPTCVCQVHAQVSLSSFVNPTPTHIVGETTPESTPSQMPLPNPESNSSIMTLVVSPRSLEGSASSIGLGLSHRGQAPPIPGVAIPDIGKGPGAWKKAVKQWEEGDPAQGLLPLREWPKEWYTGLQQTKTGAKHGQRKIIGLEFERLGHDDSAFLAEYLEANESVGKLLKILRKRGGRKERKSKNGTPEQRQHSVETPDANNADMDTDG
ncbi:hypothetical protein ARMGADRAFT_1048794 [Armillaria gallica]|uniref:Uncharacterized protein n=1 Tax=Armillaria gallica TaxID=47427 RepID=A0A2H3CI64_ARMGA|nr:hypothetical protein ARMGADRAFT_1048794 [Armillaria gallica]